MVVTAFEISIYSNKKISSERWRKMAEKSPPPTRLCINLDPNDLQVAKEKIPRVIALPSPNRQQMVEAFSDRALYRANVGTTLSFGRGQQDRGYVNLWLDPHSGDSAQDVYGETDLAPELRKRRMLRWKNIASIAHEGGDVERVDRRVFDYGRIMVENLIPRQGAQNYTLLLTDGLDHYSLVSRTEFLGQLEQLVKKHCEG